MTSSTLSEADRLSTLKQVLLQIQDKLDSTNERRTELLTTLEQCNEFGDRVLGLKNDSKPLEILTVNEFVTDWVRSIMPRQHRTSRFELSIFHNKTGIQTKITVTKSGERPRDALLDCGRPLSAVIGIGLLILSNILDSTPRCILLDDPGQYLTSNMEHRLLKQLSILGSIYQLQTLYMLSDRDIKIPSESNVIHLSNVIEHDSERESNQPSLVDFAVPISSIEISNIRQHKLLTLTFCQGLNVISGPVGFGKSSIVNCFLQVLSNRSNTLLIKDDELKASIKFSFSHSRELFYTMTRKKKSNNHYQLSSMDDVLLCDSPKVARVPTWLNECLPFIHPEQYSLTIRRQSHSINHERDVLKQFVEHVFLPLSDEHRALIAIESDTLEKKGEVLAELEALDQDIVTLKESLQAFSPLIHTTYPTLLPEQNDAMSDLITEWSDLEVKLKLINKIPIDECLIQLLMLEQGFELTELLYQWSKHQAALKILAPVVGLVVPLLPSLDTLHAIKQYGVKWKRYDDALAVLAPLSIMEIVQLPDESAINMLNKYGHAWSEREADITRVQSLIDQFRG